MFRAIAMIIGLAFAVFAGFVGGLIANPGAPSTQSLDADIAGIQSELVQSLTAAALYGEGSVMRNQAELRTQILQTTISMLEQKRASLVRIVALDYRVDGQKPPTPTADEVAGIESEIASARLEAKTAAEKAAGYTGGMFKLLHEMEEQSHLVRVAVLRQHGILMRLGFASAASRPVLPPIGRSTNDQGAL